jgi:hypothetical protein
MKKLDDFTKCIIIFVLGFVLGVVLTISFNMQYSSPVGNNVVIDSLTKTRDSIKIKVTQLDSIKNAKVVEVSTLDNDSTLKLFYELVSK